MSQDVSYAVIPIMLAVCIRMLHLLKNDVNDLLEFLKTLIDPCVKDSGCLVPCIPHSMSSGGDSLKLNAIDNTGALLYKNEQNKLAE